MVAIKVVNLVNWQIFFLRKKQKKRNNKACRKTKTRWARISFISWFSADSVNDANKYYFNLECILKFYNLHHHQPWIPINIRKKYRNSTHTSSDCGLKFMCFSLLRDLLYCCLDIVTWRRSRSKYFRWFVIVYRYIVFFFRWPRVKRTDKSDVGQWY